MNTFDYSTHKIVGYVDSTYNGNASIEVVGYYDLGNLFHQLTESESLEFFPPRGRIFAHNFSNRHYDLVSSLACVSIKANEKDGDNLDAYIWDKSEEVYGCSRRIENLDGILSEDGDNNFNVLVDNDLIEIEEDKFIISDEKVFHIKSENKERFIFYWDQKNLNIIQIQGKKFIIGFSLPEYDGCIDITNDDQLIDWYITKILKKQWAEILKEQKFKLIEPYIKEVLLSLKGLNPVIIENRMKRLGVINRNFLLTLEELQHVANSPWFSNTVNKSIDKYKQEYLSSIMSGNEEELLKLKEEHKFLLQEEKKHYEQQLHVLVEAMESNQKILKDQEKELISAIENKQLDLAILQEDIDKKNKTLTSLEQKLTQMEERRDSIVEDFSVVKEVMGMTQTQTSKPYLYRNENYSLEEYTLASAEAIMYQAFKKSLENTFIENNLPHNGISTIGDQIAFYKMLLVPDIAIAKAIIVSAFNCAYMTTYVSAHWKSFEDLWENGLGYLFGECYARPKLMHFLILQNINLTYLPNYMQPLFDLQSGVIKKLPQYGLAFPENLRILCTLTGDEVLPLSEKSLKFIGCIDPTSFNKEFYAKVKEPSDTKFGYLSPKLLIEAEKEIEVAPNFYKNYIHE